MTDEEQWRIFHRYRRLAARGQVEPMRCPSCEGEEVVTKIGPEDEPALRCFNCGAVTVPGLNMLGRFKTEVERVDGQQV